MKHIVALGGGGFTTRPKNFVIDEYILSLTDKARPSVCFLPQASAEEQGYITKFFEAYTELGALPSWLSLFGRVPDGWKEHLMKQDVIYVGGGNTRSMLALWKEWGVDNILKEAYEKGTVLAGISAGAICWFEQGVTDSVWPLGVLDCLGLISGSCCPHYDGEPERRPAFTQMVTNQTALPGLALCDGSAAHYIDGELEKILVYRSKACAYSLGVVEGSFSEEKLPVTSLHVER